MKILKEIAEVKEFLQPFRSKQKIVFIPTMGNLHEGHLELIREAKKYAEIVVVSIFVNPLQFGPQEDFSIYPRTFQEDCEKLSALEVSLLFAPDIETMYGNLNNQTIVNVPKISSEYCGQFRPNFFEGVATIVLKLFNIIQPNFAVFGEKDFQQLHIIKKMVVDLSVTTEIISVPTVREQDGLAMSSRNQYLNQEERILANNIFKTLHNIKNELLQGKAHDQIILDAKTHLCEKNFKVDYINICHKETLAAATTDDKELIILMAAWLGKTRLIDNLIIHLE